MTILSIDTPRILVLLAVPVTNFLVKELEHTVYTRTPIGAAEDDNKVIATNMTDKITTRVNALPQ